MNRTEWTAPGMGEEVLTLAHFIEMNREDRLELPMLVRTDLEIVRTGIGVALDVPVQVLERLFTKNTSAIACSRLPEAENIFHCRP